MPGLAVVFVTMGAVGFLQRAKNSFLLFVIGTVFPHCVTSRDTGHPQGWKWVSCGELGFLWFSYMLCFHRTFNQESKDILRPSTGHPRVS